MNILLVGKTGSIMHWTEDMEADLRIAGHAVTVVPSRNPRLGKALERALLSPRFGAPLARHIVRRMRRVRPDLILAIGCLDEFPMDLFQPLAAAPGRPPMAAWVGDIFTPDMAGIAGLFDLVAYTDSGMVDAHERIRLPPAERFCAPGGNASKQGRRRSRRAKPGARVRGRTDCEFDANC